jgi:mercuric ion transport protein
MSLDRSRSDTAAPTSGDAAPRPPGVAALGAVVSGIAALSCCVLPLVFALAGISGAWIANLTALSPYQPIFIAVALASVGYGHLTAHRARRACAAGGACVGPWPRRLVDAGLWLGTIMVAIAIVADFAVPVS